MFWFSVWIVFAILNKKGESSAMYYATSHNNERLTECSTSQFCFAFELMHLISSLSEWDLLTLKSVYITCSREYWAVLLLLMFQSQIQSCRLKHVESLWLLLSYMRSRMQANNGQVCVCCCFLHLTDCTCTTVYPAVHILVRSRNVYTCIGRKLTIS